MAPSTAVGRCTCTTGAGRSVSSGNARCRSRSARPSRRSALLCARYASMHRRDARGRPGVGGPRPGRHKLVRRLSVPAALASLPGAPAAGDPRPDLPAGRGGWGTAPPWASPSLEVGTSKLVALIGFRSCLIAERLVHRLGGEAPASVPVPAKVDCRVVSAV